ncbi:MAG: MarR family winged helix-turn-helix transcriptional regulator [Bacillota bacterium]|jgi:DNA-binding MarR family transcriptional regulator
MDTERLRDELMDALAGMYEKKAIAALAEFLQGELRILVYLSQHRGDGVNPSQLSDRLHVSRSRITAALSALRRKGYVQMEISEADRRRMLVTITPAGAAHLRSKQEQVERYFDHLVEGMGEENVRQLIRLIELSNQIIGDEE